MAIKVKADFSGVSEQAKKLADQFSLSMKNASEAGAQSVFGSYSKSYKKIGALQANLERERGNLERQRAAREVKEAELKVKNDLKAARGELSHAKFVEKIQTENALKVAAIRAESDKDTRNALKAEIRANQELLFLSHQSVSSAKKLNDEIREVSLSIEGIDRAIEGVGHTIAHIEKDSEKVAKNLKEASDRAESAAKEIHDFFKDLGDASKFGDKIEGVGEKIGEAFKDGIDVQALSQDLGKGVGKVLSTVGKSLGGNAGVMVGALGGVVAMVGLLLAAFIGFDKKIKEFNKDIIKTHGALSVMRLGGGNLNEGLRILKRTVSDLSGNFGVSEEDAKTLFDALDKGGITLASLTQGTRNADAASRSLSSSLRDIYAVANTTGVGLSEYTDNLTNYVNDLAMSTQTVNDSFASIAQMASDSAFGTRRFYSMVVQATQGQTSLNTRLEDTGDLLLRMSKIMGQKKAAEMIGGAKLSDKSTQELTKMVISSRGGMRRVIAQEARTTSGNLARQAYGRGQGAAAGGATSAVGQALSAAHLSTEIATAMEQAGISGDSTALINTIKRMDPTAQADAITAMTNSTDRGVQDTGRRLQEVVTNIRGMTGGIGAQTEAMANFGPRGSIMAVMASTNGVLGNLMEQNGEISERNLMALENVSGYSREQVASMRAVLRSSNATWRTMTRIRDDGGQQTDAERIASARANGAIVRSGKIIQASVDSMGHLVEGAQLTSARDMMANENTALDATGEAARTAMDVAQDTMDATVSVADILENKVARVMQSLYEVVEGPIQSALSWIMDKMGITTGSGGQTLRNTRDTSRAIDEKIASIMDAKRRTASNITKQRGIIEGATSTPDQKVAARLEIKRLQDEAASRQDPVALQALTEARGRQRSGTNDYDSRAFRLTGAGGNVGAFSTYAEAQSEMSRRGAAGDRITQEQMSPERTVERILSRALTPMVPGATPTAPGTAAPTATATPAPPVPAHAEVAAAPVVEQGQDAQAQDQQHHVQTRRDARQRDQRAQAFNEKLLKGKDLGDGLAMSKLPDAIAEAQLRMRLTEELLKAGKNPAEIQALLGGRASEGEIGDTGESRFGIQALRGRAVHDFISQDRGGRTVITPIDRADQVTGQKPGGPIAAAGRGAGGNVNISINGGDERRVFDVVRRAIQQAGITPNRVPGG